MANKLTHFYFMTKEGPYLHFSVAVEELRVEWVRVQTRAVEAARLLKVAEARLHLGVGAVERPVRRDAAKALVEDAPRGVEVALALLDDGVRRPAGPVQRILHDGFLDELPRAVRIARAHLQYCPRLQELHVVFGPLVPGHEALPSSVIVVQ